MAITTTGQISGTCLIPKNKCVDKFPSEGKYHCGRCHGYGLPAEFPNRNRPKNLRSECAGTCQKCLDRLEAARQKRKDKETEKNAADAMDIVEEDDGEDPDYDEPEHSKTETETVQGDKSPDDQFTSVKSMRARFIKAPATNPRVTGPGVITVHHYMTIIPRAMLPEAMDQELMSQHLSKSLDEQLTSRDILNEELLNQKLSQFMEKQLKNPEVTHQELMSEGVKEFMTELLQDPEVFDEDLLSRRMTQSVEDSFLNQESHDRY